MQFTVLLANNKAWTRCVDFAAHYIIMYTFFICPTTTFRFGEHVDRRVWISIDQTMSLLLLLITICHCL